MTNTPNKPYKTTCGKTIWHSRSVACVVTVFVKLESESENTYCLLVKRGKNVDNNPNKLCLPCGYIDWDEDGLHCANRELFEETGLVISDLPVAAVHYDGLFGFTDYEDQPQPWFVNSDPTRDELQNVSLYFGEFLTLNSDKLPTLTSENNDGEGEIQELMWVNLRDLHKFEDQIAFNHEVRIKQFRSFLLKTLI